MKNPFKQDGAAASANLDDVRRAFYQEYTAANHEMEWWWIQAVLTDPNELVVEDDETGQLFKIPFTSASDGSVSFGDAAPVRIDYIPDNRDAQKAAATHVAAVLAAGRQVLASYPNREDSVLPANASGGAMDPKEIRKRLGLPEDASDEQVREAVKALNTAVGETPGDGEGEGEGEGEGDGSSDGEGEGEGEEEPEAATPPVAVAAKGVPEGMVLIDSATLETLKTGASAGLEVKSRTDKNAREQLVAAAIGDGRIAPASREHWLKSLENSDKIGDPGIKATLETMPKGLIPLELRGQAPSNASTGDPAQGELNDEIVQTWSDSLFPEVRERRARDKALAAGEPVSRNRIQADATYRR